MGLFDFWKRKGVTVTDSHGNTFNDADGSSPSASQPRFSIDYNFFDLFGDPLVASHNYMELFHSLPEVFWPIDYIASRIAGATFVLKSVKTDAIKYHNKDFNKMTTHPNCLQCWSELVYQFWVHKLATGNSFMSVGIADTFASSDQKFKWASNFWVLPSDNTQLVPQMSNIPLFGVGDVEEFIKCYRVSCGTSQSIEVPVSKVWHDRDGIMRLTGSSGTIFTAESRLASQKRPVSNLISVYEARNVIYCKRGALGFVVNKTTDPTGDVPMNPDEVKELLEQTSKRYGLEKGKYPYGFSNKPIDFVRTNLSIQDLQPFEETLLDAINIAAAYGIPSVLVPRKDQSTFSNQAAAEKAVYTGVIIPMAKAFCNDLTHWLGYDTSGLYIDVDFSDVDCLQEGLLDRENVKEKVNNRCAAQFNSGLITLNDWRAQIGEEEKDENEYPMFSKLKFDMTDAELAVLDKIMPSSGTNSTSNTGLTNNNQNPQTENGNNS